MARRPKGRTPKAADQRSIPDMLGSTQELPPPELTEDEKARVEARLREVQQESQHAADKIARMER